MSDMVERVAGAISEARTGNSLSWRHYVAEAQAAIAAMQADAAPVAWKYTKGQLTPRITIFRQPDAGDDGWTETPLYAHPPVADRVSTSSPADVSETPETSGKLAGLQIAADKLAGYAGHDEDCEIMKHGVWTDSIPCTCGYTDAWWAYEAAKQASK